MPDCQHEWALDQVNGRPVHQCVKCPRWKLSLLPSRPARDPERTRRAMEETSRYLGEHRDV